MTDHRAEAEKWLAKAADIWNEPRDHDDPPIDQLRIISRALVGIGHALLAGPLEPPKWATATLVNTETAAEQETPDA